MVAQGDIITGAQHPTHPQTAPLPASLPVSYLPAMTIAGRTALVCGGTQGIGSASAIGLAGQAATVILLARDPERLEQAQMSLPRPTGATHEAIAADLNDPVAVAALIGQRIAAKGPIEILINNAGGPPAGPVSTATADAFVTAFRQHILANQLLAQTVIPGMRSQGYGRIINIVSTSVRQPIGGLGVSNTIRAAVAGWAKTLSNELGASGITVNNVLPGATKTGRLDAIIANRAKATGATIEEVAHGMESEIPLGRFATADEIAAAVIFLASPAASYITGVSLPVDGGRISSI